MPIWGTKSERCRATLHGDLIKVLDAVLAESNDEQDFAIICGLRNEIEQTEAYRAGKSKIWYDKSYHNKSKNDNGTWDHFKSDAADVVPIPVEWPNKDMDLPHEYIRKMLRFYDLAYRIMKKAYDMGVQLEWGGMFDSFFDGPHFQRKYNVSR